MIPVAITAYFYAPLFWPITKPPQTTNAADIRIATFNIWNHNKDFQGITTIINDINADVIAIQELTEEQKPQLKTMLLPTYPHHYISQTIYGGTTALFSKHPLENIQELDFGIDRPAILADMTVNGIKMTAISAHLNPSFWAYHNKLWREIPAAYHQYIKDQNTQASMIVEAASKRSQSQAIFLACDCNSQETASTNRVLGAFFKDAFRTIGWQLGSPTEENLAYEHKLSHIDYIWFNGEVTPLGVYRAKNTAGSDHNPIVADFKFERP